jgi:hypothetical protein
VKTNESSRPIKTVISSSSVHSTVNGRAAVKYSTAATTMRISAAEEHPQCSLPSTSASDDEHFPHRRTVHTQSYGCCWIVIPHNTDRARPAQRMQSRQVVRVRSRAFLLAGLLSLEVNDQQKRARCDIANVLLDTVSDKYGKTLRCFHSLLRKRGALSLTSVQHKRCITNTHECHIDVAITAFCPMQYVSLVVSLFYILHVVFRNSCFILSGSVN